MACAGLRRMQRTTTALRFLFVKEGLDQAGKFQPGVDMNKRSYEV